MIKVISVLKRRPDMDVEAFQDYWLNVHGPIAAGMPGVRRYVQSHTLLGGYRKGQPAADGIAELWFDDTDALRALQGTATLEATMADHVEFVAADGHMQIVTEEHVIKDGAAPTGVKNVEFVKRKPGMVVADFQHYWREVHGPLGAAIGPIKRYVQSHTRRSAYRDGKTPALDGMALTWFDDTDGMRASAKTAEYDTTREDEENFVAIPLDFIITREHLIVE